MTYKEKAVELFMEQLEIHSRTEAEEIVDAIDMYCMYKPSVIGKLNAPIELEDWNSKVEE